MRNYIFILFIFLQIATLAQKENNNWFINAISIFNFNEIPFRIDSINLRAVNDGYNVAVSDKAGNLLFISESRTVFDRYGERMPNGRLDQESPIFITTPSQPVVVIPVLESEHKYYLFHTLITSEIRNVKLFYSIVDMELNGGKGDIVATKKKILLGENLTGHIVAIQGICGSVWLVAHEVNSNRFLSFEVTKNGVNAPVISEVGVRFNGLGLGAMHVNPSHNKLICFNRQSQSTQLFDFDRQTGKISNPISLPIRYNSPRETYPNAGVFSNTGRYLYSIEQTSRYTGSRVVRFDVNSNDSISIAASKIAIDSFPRWHTYNVIQRAPDGNIYGTVGRLIYRIEHPDADDPNQVVVTDSLFGTSTNAFIYNFQNLIVIPTAAIDQDTMLLPMDTSLCAGQELRLNVAAQGGNSYLWQDDSTSPEYTVRSPGIYTVQIKKGNCTFRDTLHVAPLEVTLSLPMDTSFCAGDTLLLRPATNASALLWQDGSTDSQYAVQQRGVYTVTATAQGCSKSQSIVVEAVMIDEPNLPSDTTLCAGQTLVLTLPSKDWDEIIWNDQIRSPRFEINQPGNYRLTLLKGGCERSTTFEVQVADCGRKLLIPNAFSPNQDQRNDVFRVLNLESLPIQSFEIKIYNRWGDLVFQSQDITKGWDGTKQGDGITDLPSDVYVYYYTVQLEGLSELLTRKGDVTLVR